MAQSHLIVEQTDREITALARAVAAQMLVTDEQARAEDYDTFVEMVQKELSASFQSSQYQRQSSLGAYLLSCFALRDTQFSEDISLRETALDAAQLRDALADVDDGIWLDALYADWEGTPDDFCASPKGLSIGVLAGLCESSLTRVERHSALSQLSFCFADTSRLLEVRKIIRNTQQVLMVIPAVQDNLGIGYILVMTAMALHLPERALELVQQVPPDPELGSVLHELAKAGASLMLGHEIDLAADKELPSLQFETENEVSADSSIQAELEDDDYGADDDEEAILEIVEQVISTKQAVAVDPLRNSRPPSWSVGDNEPVEVDESSLRMWFEGRAQRQSTFGALSGLLGLRQRRDFRRFRPLPPDMATINELLEYHSEPPDPSTAETERIDVATFMASQRERLGMCSVRPLFPIIRTCLRAIARAPEGGVLTPEVLANSGDAHSYLARARRLGLLSEGRLQEASSILGAMESQSLDEIKLELVSKCRFIGREELPEAGIRFLDRPRARQAAANMVFDLSMNFGKTVAGVID